jgi:hypothetical protein
VDIAKAVQHVGRCSRELVIVGPVRSSIPIAPPAALPFPITLSASPEILSDCTFAFAPWSRVRTGGQWGLAVIFQDVVPLQLPRKPVVAGAVRKWKSAVTISRARTYRAVIRTAR